MIICLCLLNAHYVEAGIFGIGEAGTLEINDYLKQLKTHASDYEGPCPGEVDSNTGAGFVEDAPIKRHHCPRSAARFCADTVGAEQAKAGLTVGVPLEWRPQKLSKRWHTPGQIDIIASHLAKYFYHTIRDKAFLARCCAKNDQHCVQSIQETQFLVDKGMSVSDPATFETSFTDGGADSNGRFNSGQLKMSVADIASFNSASMAEMAIQHELAHACHFGSVTNSSPDKHCWKGKKRVIMPTQAEIDRFVGRDTWNCIVGALERAAPQAQADLNNHTLEMDKVNQGAWFYRSPDDDSVCHSAWQEEALADATFSSNYTHPLSWAMLCGNDEWGPHGDPNTLVLRYNDHPPRRSYLKCLLNKPALKNRFCTNPKETIGP